MKAEQKRGRDDTHSKDSDRKDSKDIKVSARKKMKASGDGNQVMDLTPAGEEEQELQKGTHIRCHGLVGTISEHWNGMSGTITEVVADDSALKYWVILENGFARYFSAENLEVVEVQTHHLDSGMRIGMRIKCHSLKTERSRGLNGLEGFITEIRPDKDRPYRVKLDNKSEDYRMYARNLQVVEVQTHHLDSELQKHTRIRCHSLGGKQSKRLNGLEGIITNITPDKTYVVKLDNNQVYEMYAHFLHVVKVHELPNNNVFDDVPAKPAMPQASEGGRDSTPVLPRTDTENLSALVDEMMENRPLTWTPEYFDTFDPDQAILNN
jgi:hypothetical protein